MFNRVFSVMPRSFRAFTVPCFRTRQRAFCLRATLAFPIARRSITPSGDTWRRVWEEIGDARLERVAARFYEWSGGPDKPLSFDPPATLAIAARPGDEVTLEGKIVRLVDRILSSRPR